MTVVLTSAAEADISAALAWYETYAPDATPRFLDELDRLTGRLAVNPRQFPCVRGKTRRAGFRRFPYGFFFQILGAEVVVFARFHASRDPAHGHGRA